MTRLASESWDVVAAPEEPAYELNEVCAVPGCNHVATDNHHIWRRSFIIDSDAYWVRVNGTLVPNRVGLCQEHHRHVTGDIGGHKATVMWFAGVFFWVDDRALDKARSSEPSQVAQFSQPLIPQPGARAMQMTIDGDEVPHEHVVAAHGPETKCPRCKGKGTVAKPEPKPEGEKKEERPKVTWAVRVPKDERENGHQLLEERMELAIEKCFDAGLIRDKNKGASYYALLFALDFFNQDFDPKTMEEGE